MLFTELSTTMSQVGLTLLCITCQERKSQKPSKTATFLEDGFVVIRPSVSMVVMSALVVRFCPLGCAMAQPPELLGKPIQV